MEKTKRAVSAEEQDQISRKLMTWINTCPEIPADVGVIQYEYLDSNLPAMALSAIQGAYITKKYILGGYVAEYQFKVIYRFDPGKSNDKRLKADEMLNAMGAWMEKNRPDLGDGKRAVSAKATTLASLFGRYEDGVEDHQILAKMEYEVNV